MMGCIAVLQATNFASFLTNNENGGVGSLGGKKKIAFEKVEYFYVKFIGILHCCY